MVYNVFINDNIDTSRKMLIARRVFNFARNLADITAYLKEIIAKLSASYFCAQ